MKRQGSFVQRLVFGTLFFALFYLLVSNSRQFWFSGVFTVILTLITTLSLVEFYELCINKGSKPLIKLGLATSVLYICANFLSVQNPAMSYLPLWILVGSLPFLFIPYFMGATEPLTNLSVSIFGIIYLTVPLSYILNITYFDFSDAIQNGSGWLFYLVIVTKITDIAAYTIGRTFGKNLLAPRISPKKTVEGAIGGLVMAVVTSFLLAYLSQLQVGLPASISLSYPSSILLGLALGGFAQIGDLSESILKRDANVKDSSNLPGFGGFLDLFDSMIFTTPLLYFYLQGCKLIG